MESFQLITLIAITFLIAGTIKGIIGFGLPSVVLALLTATVGLKEAMILLIVPCIITNIWQALGGPHLRRLVPRMASFLAAMCFTTWLGARWHSSADASWLVMILGVLLCVYAAIGLGNVRLPSPGAAESIWSPVVGLATGLLNGLTGTFVIPGVIYLQALGLNREALVQAMGLLFVISTTALALSMRAAGLMDPEFIRISALALLPTVVGMAIGIRIRRRLSETQFRRTFFMALGLFGVYLAFNVFIP